MSCTKWWHTATINQFLHIFPILIVLHQNLTIVLNITIPVAIHWNNGVIRHFDADAWTSAHKSDVGWLDESNVKHEREHENSPCASDQTVPSAVTSTFWSASPNNWSQTRLLMISQAFFALDFSYQIVVQPSRVLTRTLYSFMLWVDWVQGHYTAESGTGVWVLVPLFLLSQSIEVWVIFDATINILISL